MTLRSERAGRHGAGTRGERLRALWALVGDTPLIDVRCRVRGRDVRIFAKYEALNFTGSIKDRMALHMLQEASESGRLRPGQPIAEASSGNTGISFAALGRALGHEVRVFLPDWMSRERQMLIDALGATLVPVSHAQGGFLGSIALADAWAAESGAFRPHQFASRANVDAHRRTTGPELVAQFSALGLAPTAFVAGVGTGGTVMGVGAHLRECFPDCAIHPLEPADSPTLRTGCKVGAHRIQGISDEFVPPIIDLHALGALVDVRDGDAILMAQALSRTLGLAVGISSGANFLGAVMIALEQGPRALVATVFPDSNKKYLSTDLCRDEPVLAGYLAPRIELQEFRALPRAGISVERASGIPGR